ncbi:endonuclease/exonuclease/phosphatase family protein [Algoriphagus namhaensis]
MKLKIAVFNVKWMRDLFTSDGEPNQTGKDHERSLQLAKIFRAMQPDFIGIVEGPNTLVNLSKTASGQLEAWLQVYVPESPLKGIHGFPSPGQQELCALYDPTKMKVLFTPETRAGKRFDEPFLMDTTNRLIKEQYKHYRPPLELTILGTDDTFISRVIIAHTKSKGIFDMVDYARFEQISSRDRLKLFAECMSIRDRCDEYLEKGQEVIVMGDINDGFELDFYENRFSKSAVEILLGDTWKPEFILKSVLPKPRLNSYGWTPNSSRYRDRITGDQVNVLIDHILVSQGLLAKNGKVWNPYLEKEDPVISGLKNELMDASDHFPVVCEIEIKN